MGDIRRMLEPLTRAIKFLASKGSVEAVDDSTALQTLQVTIGQDELLDQVPRLQQFGITSVPSEGDEAVVVLLGGERDQAVVVALDSSQKRPTGLSEGEVAVYRDPANMVVFKANGDIEVHAEGKLKVIPDGDIELGATAAVKALVNDTFQSIFNAHTHVFPASPPNAPTGPPVPTMTPGNLTTKAKAE